MEPASLPAFSRDARPGGVIIPPHAPHRRGARALFVAQRAQPGRAPRRPARAARRAPARRAAASTSCASDAARERVAAAMDELYAYSERMVRAAIARLPDGRWRGGGRRRGGRRRAADPLHGRGRRRRDPDRLRRHGAAVRRQPQLPALGDEVGVLLRRPLSHRARPAGVGRRLRARSRSPRPRAASSTRARRRRSSPATPRRRRASSTSCSRAFGEALPVPAQGQGTMNNVALGNDRFTYYETIGGGQGACPDADGPSGVHVAMSNTLIDAGRGARALVSAARRALGAARAAPAARARTAAATASCASCACSRTAGSRCSRSAARTRPPGRAGGEDGAPGRTLVNGEEQPAKLTRQLRAGDVVRIETPGGGGFGSPSAVLITAPRARTEGRGWQVRRVGGAHRSTRRVRARAPSSRMARRWSTARSGRTGSLAPAARRQRLQRSEEVRADQAERRPPESEDDERDRDPSGTRGQPVQPLRRIARL